MLLSPGFGSDGNAKLRQLLAQRERLMGEISAEEQQQAGEMAEGRRLISEAEAQERDHREAACEEQSRSKLAEDQLAWPEATGAVQSLAATATSGLLGGVMPAPAVLFEEVKAAKEELGMVRSARAALVEAKATSDRQRLEEWIIAIRTGSQENQALQANQQMAQAHLKALEAMATSSCGQVRVREAALQGLLKQLEEQECVGSEMRERAEAAETLLEASMAEVRRREAHSSPFSIQIAQHEELKQEREALISEVNRLKQEGLRVQEHLETGRQTLFPDNGLRSSLVQLRSAYEAAVSASKSSKCSAFESDVARLTSELLEEQRAHSDLQELHGMSATAPLHEERPAAEEEALVSELAEHEADCERMRVEAAERQDQFTTITRDLQEQIASLRSEEQDEELRARGLSVGYRGSPSPAADFSNIQRQSPAAAVAAAFPPMPNTFGGVMPILSGAGMSAPPGSLRDPGRGSEPPPRRNSHQELSQTALAAYAAAMDGHGGAAAYGDSRGRMLIPSPHELNQAPEEVFWQTHRAASHSPGPLARQMHQTADPSATLLMPGRARPEQMNSSWFGSSPSSHLFHTHNASASLDSGLYRTPLAGRPQQASPMATTIRRGGGTLQVEDPARLGFGFEAWTRGSAGSAGGSSPPRRARTPPGRPPSMPGGLLGAGEEMLPGLVRQASAASYLDYRGGPSPQARQFSPPARLGAETEAMPMAAHFANARERRAAFQARIAELKGVIGASLQSLDEEEVNDNMRWGASRTTALADREETLWGLQHEAAQEMAAATVAATMAAEPGLAGGELW